MSKGKSDRSVTGDGGYEKICLRWRNVISLCYLLIFRFPVLHKLMLLKPTKLIRFCLHLSELISSLTIQTDLIKNLWIIAVSFTLTLIAIVTTLFDRLTSQKKLMFINIRCYNCKCSILLKRFILNAIDIDLKFIQCVGRLNLNSRNYTIQIRVLLSTKMNKIIPVKNQF